MILTEIGRALLARGYLSWQAIKMRAEAAPLAHLYDIYLHRKPITAPTTTWAL